jgi:hypothetical protein
LFNQNKYGTGIIMTELMLEKRKKKPEWFLKLVEELKGLLNKEKQARTMLIKTRHMIGKKILEAKRQPDFYEVFESVPKYMKALSEEIGISEAELYAYEKLAEKFPDLNQLYAAHSDVRGHELSWHTIEHEILYPSKKEAPSPVSQERLVEKLEKMCQFERDLHVMLQILEKKRPETIKCEDCPKVMRAWCSKARPKILAVGSELAELEA